MTDQPELWTIYVGRLDEAPNMPAFVIDWDELHEGEGPRNFIDRLLNEEGPLNLGLAINGERQRLAFECLPASEDESRAWREARAAWMDGDGGGDAPPWFIHPLIARSQ